MVADKNPPGVEQLPHRRYNPLLREWVLVSPHRTDRPWQGKVEAPPLPAVASYDPSCYLCPGNERAGGHRNPQYSSTFVFENDFAALRPDLLAQAPDRSHLLRASSERGICRVLCFSPLHDLTIPRMNEAGLRAILLAFGEQYRTLEREPWIRYVQLFENRGAMMGASNPHPHCQIWATETVPNISARESSAQLDYQREKNSCLLCDYLQVELAERSRIVLQNRSFVALIPYWAVWPFETMVLAKRHFGAFLELTPDELEQLGDLLRRLTIRYDNLFEIPFPYSMGFHQRPSGSGPHAEWHFHAHFVPPLLRSATVQKFMVGFELLGMPQRDFTPEEAAARLIGLPEVHYLDRPRNS